jgi:ribosomal protein L4
MKQENINMAKSITDLIINEFKGLSEKGDSKMMKSVIKSAGSLSKKFNKLLELDSLNIKKTEKKISKKVIEKLQKLEIKTKVEAILGKSESKPKDK